MQEIEIVRERGELPVWRKLAAERNDEGPAAKGMEVGRRGAEPGDELRFES